jgi:hypothetical protein
MPECGDVSECKGWKRCIININLSRECEWNKDLSVVVTRLDKIDKVQIQIHKDLLVCYTLCQKKKVCYY